MAPVGFGSRAPLGNEVVGRERQLAPLRVAVEYVALRVGCNRYSDKEDFAALDRSVAFVKRDTARPKRFHLGAEELDSGLELLEHLIVAQRFAVGCDSLHHSIIRDRKPQSTQWPDKTNGNLAGSLFASDQAPSRSG